MREKAILKYGSIIAAKDRAKEEREVLQAKKRHVQVVFNEVVQEHLPALNELFTYLEVDQADGFIKSVGTSYSICALIFLKDSVYVRVSCGGEGFNLEFDIDWTRDMLGDVFNHCIRAFVYQSYQP